MASGSQSEFPWKAVGYVRSPYTFKNGTPRQATVCKQARGIITIDKTIFNNPEHSLEGLQEFTHIWILFIFHKNNNQYSKAKVKPPRLNGGKVGLFSTRSPYRPNNIGLTLAKIETIQGASVSVSGIDILDGTPVIDIKPYIPQYDCPKLAKASAESSPETGVSNTISNSTETDVDYTPDTNINEDTEIEANTCIQNTSNSSAELSENADTLDTAVKEEAEIEKKSSNDLELTCENSEGVVTPESSLVGHGSQADNLLNRLSACDPCTANQDGSEMNDDEKPRLNTVKVENGTYGAKTVETCDTGIADNDVKPIEKSILYSEYGAKTVETCDVKRGVSDLKNSKKNKDNGSLDPSNKKHEHLANEPVSDDKLSAKDKENTSLSTAADWIASPPVSKLEVRYTPRSLTQLSQFSQTTNDQQYKLKFLKSPDEARLAIIDILHEDPRSVYRRNKCVDSLYYFTLDVIHVTCWFDTDDGQDAVEVVRIKSAYNVGSHSIKPLTADQN